MKKLLSYMGVGLLTVIGQQGLHSHAAEPLPVESPAVPSVTGGTAKALNRARTPNESSGFYPEDESPWFANDNLRRELNLDNDQIKRLNDIYSKTRDELRRNQTDNPVGLADQQRSATRLNEYRNRFDDQFNRSSSEIFRNAQQQQRFNQLRLQYQGYGAFNNPALRRQMNLDDTQIRQLQDLNQEWDTQMDEFRNSYAKDREGTTNRYNDFNQSARTRFEGILNDQQRQRYNEMTGSQFDFGADARLGNRNTNAQANTSGAIEGSGIGTPQGGVPQGSGIGTPGNVPQGSGLGTPAGGVSEGSGIGLPENSGTQGSGTGSGTGAGAGTGTGGGTGTGSGAGAGSGSASGSGSGS